MNKIALWIPLNGKDARFPPADDNLIVKLPSGKNIMVVHTGNTMANMCLRDQYTHWLEETGDERVVMSREMCDDLFTAGANYSEGQYRKLEYGQPNEYPDLETTLNNLFKP